MATKPTYEELERRVQALQEEVLKRKQAEKALRESEEKYRTILESIEEIYFEVGLAGNFTFFNDSLSKSLGYSDDELRGMNNRDYMSPESVKEIYNLFNQIYTTGNPAKKATYGIIRKDGSRGFHELSASLMKDQAGRPIGFRGIAHDITERKHAEEALRVSEANLDKAQRIAHVGSWSHNLNLNRIEWSDEMYRIFGLSKGDPAEPSFETFLSRVHPADRERVSSALKDAVEKEESFNFEFRTVPIEGSERTIRERGEVVCDETGTPVRIFGTAQDITQWNRLQAQLQEATKMEAIGTLTGGIAHDYNNLLAMIMGNLSMAREETEPHSVMAGFLHEAEQASCKARDLTHELMTLSKGGYPMKKPGSIESLLKEIAGQTQTHDGIDYTFSIQDDLWPVEYDSKQMQYVISNVLINAVEAMSQGGTITIQAENQVIENKGNDSGVPLKDGKYLRISIKDEGRGIPEEDIDKIFDPYFSTKERGVQKGMGMGLTTAYAVVEKHGGHITVNSTTGLGTTVTIYLPASAAESQAPGAKRDDSEAQSTIANQQSSIRSILVMDDEESLRNLAQKMLERLVYKVETVKDGVEAIEKYKKHMDSGEPFDGVILDLTIKGGMGGVQAIKELIKIDPDVKAIVCSGYFNDPVLTKHEEHGFRGAMAKPYQKADLEQVLKKVLG